MSEHPADAWRVVYSRRAEKDIARLDAQARRRVLSALTALAADGGHAAAARKLSGVAEWRLRVGDWRVRFTRDSRARTINVTHVLPRGRAYER